MAKKTSITKEMILDAALEIVRSKGFQSLSARNVAKKIGCSTRPIYWIYENMDAFKQDVIEKAIDCVTQFKLYKKTEVYYLDIALGYIHMAYTEPILFRAFYVDNIGEVKISDLSPDERMMNSMKEEIKKSGLSKDEFRQKAATAWLSVHGLASYISGGLIEYNEEEIIQSLKSLEMPFF